MSNARHPRSTVAGSRAYPGAPRQMALFESATAADPLDRLDHLDHTSGKQNLQKARGTVLTGYDGSGDLIQTAEDIVELSTAVRDDMNSHGLKSASAGRARRK